MLMLLPFHLAIVSVDTMTYEAQGHKGIVGPSLGLRNVLAIEARVARNPSPEVCLATLATTGFSTKHKQIDST